MKVSSDLAEFVGIVLGDGYVHKTENTIVISGSLEEEIYYRNVVAPLVKRLFDANSSIYFQKERSACYLAVNSNKAISTLLQLGFSRGKKKFKIPTDFNNTNIFSSVLRGVFDTDGCLKFSKQSKAVNYYPRIQITLLPSNFSQYVAFMLEKLGFNYGVWVEDNSKGFNKNGKNMVYHISGKGNLEKWVRIIGMSNPVHITKYIFWKKYGYYKPRMSLAERFKHLSATDKTICCSPVV